MIRNLLAFAGVLLDAALAALCPCGTCEPRSPDVRRCRPAREMA